MTTTKPKDPSGPTDQSAEKDLRPRRTLIDRLREDLLVAERLNLDFPDLYRALPASGAPITLGEIAQRLRIELRTPERNVLLYGLTRHLGIIRLRNDNSGTWMFARLPRLRPPRPRADLRAGGGTPAPSAPGSLGRHSSDV